MPILHPKLPYMQLIHVCPKTKSKLILTHMEASADCFCETKIGKEPLMAIALNGAEKQQICINGITESFPPFSIAPLVSSMVYTFDKPQYLTLWQYSKDFYSPNNSYFETSCFGVLFFGLRDKQFFTLNEDYRAKLKDLIELFIEEFQTVDTIQTEMMQMLLRRLIILTTRLAKEQYLAGKIYEEEKFKLIREFNILVDQNFKSHHQVSYYAGRLHKSPKTLTRIFKNFNSSTPSVIIQDRIMMEAKRLLFYTTLSVKEIAFELGFKDASHFSRFFKKATNVKPSDFRKQ